MTYDKEDAAKPPLFWSEHPQGKESVVIGNNLIQQLILSILVNNMLHHTLSHTNKYSGGPERKVRGHPIVKYPYLSVALLDTIC